MTRQTRREIENAAYLDGRIQAVNSPQRCEPLLGFEKRRLDAVWRTVYCDAYRRAFNDQIDFDKRRTHVV